MRLNVKNESSAVCVHNSRMNIESWRHAFWTWNLLRGGSHGIAVCVLVDAENNSPDNLLSPSLYPGGEGHVRISGRNHSPGDCEECSPNQNALLGISLQRVKMMWFRLNPVAQKLPRRTCGLAASPDGFFGTPLGRWAADPTSPTDTA